MTSTAESALYQRALERHRAADYAEARVLLEAHVAEHPDHVTGLLGLGDCHARLGNRVAAERAFRAGLAVEPAHRPLVLELARLLAAEKRYAAAATEYERYLADHPGDQQFATELATVRSLAKTHSAPSLPEGMTVEAPTGRTLAAALGRSDADAGPFSPTVARGERIRADHRRLLSHRRLWLAALTPIVLVLLFWQARAIDSQPTRLTGPLGDMPRVIHLLMAMVAMFGAMLVIAAALSSRLTRYVVYRQRVDAYTGVLFRKHRVVWMFEITEVQFEQRPHHLLGGTGTLVLYTERAALTGLRTRRLWAARRPVELDGFGSAAELLRLQELLLARVVRERHSMKRQFI